MTAVITIRCHCKKTHANASHETGLGEILKSLGVDSLVVTGLTASGCVRASAIDRVQHDFKIVISEEVASYRYMASHKGNLLDLNAKYVDVFRLTDLLALL